MRRKENTAEDGGVKHDAKVKNNTKALATSPLSRGLAEQGSFSETSKLTAAAENLGINPKISQNSEAVKRAIPIFSGIATAIDNHAPYRNSKKPITPANLSGVLIKEGILTRGGSSNSVYGEFGDHTLRISNHQAHAKNFDTSGENLSITLSGRKIGNFKGTSTNKVIEANDLPAKHAGRSFCFSLRVARLYLLYIFRTILAKDDPTFFHIGIRFYRHFSVTAIAVKYFFATAASSQAYQHSANQSKYNQFFQHFFLSYLSECDPTHLPGQVYYNIIIRLL